MTERRYAGEAWIEPGGSTASVARAPASRADASVTGAPVTVAAASVSARPVGDGAGDDAHVPRDTVDPP